MVLSHFYGVEMKPVAKKWRIKSTWISWASRRKWTPEPVLTVTVKQRTGHFWPVPIRRMKI
jgi:hypothetical protein